MKTLNSLKLRLSVLSSLWFLSILSAAPASAQDSINTRLQRPLVISLDSGWPKGLLGFNAHYAVLPHLALGAHLGWAFAPVGGIFGRWYFADTPSSTYIEGLITHYFGATTAGPSYGFQRHFSFNGLFGWEHRAADGWTFHAAAGLGVAPFMVPDTIMGQINLELGVGYAF